MPVYDPPMTSPVPLARQQCINPDCSASIGVGEILTACRDAVLLQSLRKRGVTVTAVDAGGAGA